MSERGQERAISHGNGGILFRGIPRKPSREENRVRTWQERYEVFILDTYIVTVERSAETEIPQQSRGDVLQQSVKKLIIRPVACVMSGVNCARFSAAKEISLYGTKRRNLPVKALNIITLRHTFAKLRWLRRDQYHQLIEGCTHRYPT